jgi:[ribosomal protein S5]-alanine N-acetyltransferase
MPHEVEVPLLTELSTERLALCAYEPDDAAVLFAFMSNASAMRFTYIASSVASCHERLQRYEDSRPTLGYAPWVVREKEGRQVVGWGGLSIDPEEPEWGIEVSYSFSPSAWGKGYATELVSFCCSHAFEVVGATSLQAFAMPENRASLRVLEKCGFGYVRFVPDLKRNFYRLSA